MKPPPRTKLDYEKIPVDVWVEGTIQDIQYEAERKSMFKGQEKVGPAVRFKFAFEGCQYPHYSRWFSFSYDEKSNLYKKIVSQLVEGAEPGFDFDLDALKGMGIKTMWSNNGDFQNLEMIRPLTEKITRSQPKEEIPF